MRRSRPWVAVGWVCAVLLTLLNGIVVGYGSIWFQFFGEQADAEDYAVSAGGYGAAASVLALAVPAILVHGRPWWLVWPAGLSAVSLGILAASSIGAWARSEKVEPAISTAWDGIGGVLWAPWTWVLVVLGVHGLGRIVAARSRGSM